MSEHIPAGRLPFASLSLDLTSVKDPPVTTRKAERPFVFIHVGDLHITEPPTGTCANATGTEAGAPKEPNARSDRETRLRADLTAIFEDIASIKERDSFDFVYLPGDLAENACPKEYAFLAGALKKLGGHPRQADSGRPRLRARMSEDLCARPLA